MFVSWSSFHQLFYVAIFQSAERQLFSPCPPFSLSLSDPPFSFPAFPSLPSPLFLFALAFLSLAHTLTHSLAFPVMCFPSLSLPLKFLHPSPLLSFSLSLPLSLFQSGFPTLCDFYCITRKRKMKMKIPLLVLEESMPLYKVTEFCINIQSQIRKGPCILRKI